MIQEFSYHQRHILGHQLVQKTHTSYLKTNNLDNIWGSIRSMNNFNQNNPMQFQELADKQWDIHKATHSKTSTSGRPR